ncbi:MAG: cation diffusion facilitator family transporter [Hyphomicrobiales bacterium]|nr:MAG: cation diffusion facilitator family transporter [Hyphomicrobiales bacterium]
MEKQKVALASLFASIGLTIGKTIVGVATGSLGVLSEAVHSLLDVGATAITYMAVRISDKPADSEHHFGHGKVESVTALIETGLLFLTCVWIVYEAAHRLLGDATDVTVTWWAVGVIAVSIVVDFNRSRALARAAKATHSEALAADALHFSSDMWSSSAVLIGLGATWAGYPAADALAALAVAVFVAMAGYRLGRRTIDTLIDTAPEGAMETVARIAEETPGILWLDRARIRPVGDTVFVDADVDVRRTLPFDRVTGIKAQFVKAVEDAFPNADVTVTARPVALDDETVFDKVMLIANRRGLAIHHLTVQHVAGKLSVSLDLELDGRMRFTQAHDIATALEEAISEELGEDVEVESHIEPAHLSGVDGLDADETVRADVEGVLVSLAAKQPLISDVHAVRVRSNDHGLFVTFHCCVERGLSVEAVHDAVDDLERAFRERRPSVRRVIAHAEPADHD